MPSSPTPSRGGVLKTAAAVVAWAVLIPAVVLATILFFWTAMGVVLLRGAPVMEAYVFIGILGGLAVALSWVLARYLSSGRKVGRVTGATVSVVLVAAVVWALVSQDRALFLAREVIWGDSDVLDYQKFPARTVDNAPPVFNFNQGPSSALFRDIEYTAGGRRTTADLDELLESTNTTSFVVIKDDTILYERYLNGYRRDSVVTSFSTAKSVTSALVGIAVDEGKIGGVDDRVIEYLPEMKGRGLDSLTIRDVLLMSTGVIFIHQDDKSDFKEIWPFHDEALSYYYPNMRSLALQLPAGKEPVGAAFNYNQYHPLLLGLILERTTGQSVSSYLEEKIWRPLGMEFPASWSLDSTRHGFEKMESGLNGRAIDFAKFGRLFLNNGNWNGRQIVSEGWVLESTAPDPDDHRPWLSDNEWKEAGGYYKYQWWGMPRPDGGYDFTAMGHLGQRIAVFPEDRVVVVRFGIDEEGVDNWDELIMTVAGRASSQP